jgi:hypothetical protein
MNGFVKVALKKLIEEIGEDRAKEVLSDFSCPINKDIEEFIHQKAIEFEKQSISRTQLIYASYKKELVLVGYYTIATKTFNITSSSLTSNKRRKINKFATYNPELKSYLLPAPLIAQLGKNFKNNSNSLISGNELLKIACDDISIVHKIVGGKTVYLECEDKPCLIEFYNRNGFVKFAERKLDADETNISGTYLVQMLKIF